MIHCDSLDLLSPALVESLQRAAGWPPGLSPKAGEADGHLPGGGTRFLKNEARFLGDLLYLSYIDTKFWNIVLCIPIKKDPVVIGKCKRAELRLTLNFLLLLQFSSPPCH